MPIKRREKPLTPEEAISRAKQELAPYWFGCPEPLMSAVRSEKGVQAYPLDSRMTDRAWLIFFADPFLLSARDTLLYAQSWANRYEPQKLNVMVVLKLPFAFATESLWGHKFSQQLEGPVVTVMDREALLHQAFQVQELPKLVLLSQNRQVIDRSGPAWFQGTEVEIQKFLRESDPGLPLFEPMNVPEHPVKNVANVDFGNPANETDIVFHGNWTRENDRVIPQDSQATLSFKCGGRRLGIIAQSLGERGESEIVVEAPREYPRDAGILDEDLSIDFQILSNPLAEASQKRKATAKIGSARLYYFFRALPETHREITLRFPGAERAPVALYGLRIGD
ncbi:MAG: hypothetical protein ACJ763_08510 [Bdellovibrionia bacterium]